MFAGKMCYTDCGVERYALMVLILLMKNMAKNHPGMIEITENEYGSF